MIPDDLKTYDFRQNLIVDADNPILIQKAWRDRFSGESFWENWKKKGGGGGKAYLGQLNSEDAMTWNVFRSLQLAGKQGLDVISDCFGLSTVEHVLLWGCDVQDHSDTQQLLNILIRRIDGRFKGTMTEPDLVLVTANEVVFVECKLNQNGKGSPWKAQKASGEQPTGAERRLSVYIEEEGFDELRQIQNWEPLYQIIRQYVYSKKMAKGLDKSPAVIPLINGLHAEILEPIYAQILKSPVNNQRVFRGIVTWQRILAGVESSSLPIKDNLAEQMRKALEAAR